MVAPSSSAADRFISKPPDAVRGFLLYGSDGSQISARATSLAEALSKRAGAQAELIRLHESDLARNPDHLIVELSTGSLFGGIKIVWLTTLPAKLHAALLDAVASPLTDSYLLVQAPELRKSHKVAQVFEASSTLAAIGCYGEDRETLPARIRQQVSAAGYEMDAAASELVASRCDYSALIAKSEAEKLIVFAGSDRRITFDDVDACLADQETAALSDIVDNALNGDARNAIMAFERYMAVEQNVTPILVVLSATLLKLHALRVAADTGTPVTQAIKALRPPVFFKQQDVLARQVRRWSSPALSRFISTLNRIIGESRLKPVLGEALTANLLLDIAGHAGGTNAASK